ncbi:MAG: DUF4297 domain-containing protein [Ruminococcus sp.]|nr:DUF4297 domain-containing protein [Ruminococcus sp.]
MSIVLSTEQREQAGSDSYNRFEYQIHWIVCHIIDELEKETECIIFCEFHDDMAKYSNETKLYQFYQIKTKDNPSKWTISEMSKREKNKNGGYKKSFLGFLFYNFLTFGTECAHCHFISNNDFEEDVLLWQSYIEDGKIVKTENCDLYNKIKKRIKDEYCEDLPKDFDSVFDVFIQNTFVSSSKLQLNSYEAQTKGLFFEYLADKSIPTDTANIILQQIINDVRKKSKAKIRIPISMNKLVKEKGIEIGMINRKIENKIKNEGDYSGFHEFLIEQSLSPEHISRLEKGLKQHEMRWLDVDDIKYHETIIALRKIMSSYSNEQKSEIDFLAELKTKSFQRLNELELDSVILDDLLVEVLYYYEKFQRGVKF